MVKKKARGRKAREATKGPIPYEPEPMVAADPADIRSADDAMPLFIPVGRGDEHDSRFTLESVSHAIRTGKQTDSMMQWLRNVATADEPQISIYTAAELLEQGRWTEEAADSFNRSWVYSENPETEAEIQIHTALCSDGILGMLVNLHCALVMGRGFRFELEPIEPPEDGESPRKKIGTLERSIEACLNEAGRHCARRGGALRPTLVEAVERLNKITMVHNRGCIVMHGESTMEWKGQRIRGIPAALEVVHPSDLGMVALDETRHPTFVFRNAPWNDGIDLARTMYLWNAVEGAHIKYAEGHGISPIAPAVPAARVVDKMDNEDYPVVFRVGWTGVPLFVYGMPGALSGRRAEALQALVSNYVAGGPMVLAADPEKVAVHNLEPKPQIDAMNSTREMLVAYCAHVVGLPAMSVTEGGTGRATSTARSTMTQQGTIEPRRMVLARLVSARFGQPILERNWPDVAKKWRVKVVFDAHDAESLAQKVEAANGIMAAWPITRKAYGSIIGISGFEEMGDEERTRILMEAEKNAGQNDMQAKGGTMGKGKSQSSRKMHVSKPDEQSKR